MLTANSHHLPKLRESLLIVVVTWMCTASTVADEFRVMGAQSCATTSCHGSPRPGIAQPTVRRGSEYQLWLEHDPHAQSWRTMCSDESVAMLRRLKIMQGNQIVDKIGFDNCLACHETTQQGSVPSVAHLPKEGVGCSGCHGPSEAWVHTHFRHDWSREAAIENGFVNAANLYTRARMCASCHVGDTDRDMNHDIIAAGHPALRYEFATYHGRLPKHWRDHEAEDETYYEAQLWLAGQVAALDASLALLETRANNAHTVSQWPELAAFDCASCHHELGLDNQREPLTAGRKATATYSRWNEAGIRWLIGHRMESGSATPEDAELLAAIDEVIFFAQQLASPDRHRVATAAHDAQVVLQRWFYVAICNLPSGEFRSDQLAKIVVSAAGNPDSFTTWESAVQFYLAAVAARASWPGGPSGPMHSAAHRIRVGLQYPETTDVSQYAKQNPAGPVANRGKIISDSIELAGWLGPVRHEMMFDPVDDDQRLDEDMQARLRRMIERINARWKADADGQATEASDAKIDHRNEAAEQDPVKSPEELREEIRQRLQQRQPGEDPLEADLLKP